MFNTKQIFKIMYAIYERTEIEDMMCDVFNHPSKLRIIVELNTHYTDLDYYMFDLSDGDKENIFNGIMITSSYEPLLYLENVDFDKAVDYIMMLVKMQTIIVAMENVYPQLEDEQIRGWLNNYKEEHHQFV